MREIASDFPHTNSVVPSAMVCWQTLADGTPNADKMSYQIPMRIPSLSGRAHNTGEIG
jgi:hypothetical protein